MATRVTRRDFLNGVAIGAGGVLLQGYGGGLQARTESAGSAYYPPTLTGMRGSHEG